MSEAIFGLVGVVLGALAAGLGDYLIEARRESRIVRRVARMLHLELEEARDFIEASLARSVWIAEPERVLSNEVWCVHRDEFAGVRDRDLWDCVSAAFLAIAGVRRNNLGAEAGVRLEEGDERTEDAAAVLEPIGLALDGLRRMLG